MARPTEMQQIDAAAKIAAASLPMVEWLENTWSDVKDAANHVNLLVDNLETGLNADRGRQDGQTVTLKFNSSDIEQTIWLASTIWSALDRLNDRVLDRLNQTPVETKPDPVVRALVHPTVDSKGIDVIGHINVLGEAEDRLTILQTMVDGMADRTISSAFSYAVGDVQGLVTSVRNALNAQHEGRAGA